MLPEIAFTVTPGQPLDPDALFAMQPRALWLEIGFGGGEHLAALAAMHPEIGFLGVEPFINGVAKLVRAVATGRLSNVRVLIDDARLLLPALPDQCLERAYVLFPDPWPKRRHHKRRLVNRETCGALARLLRPGGLLRLATDHREYAQWMLAAALAEPHLAWTARCARDWREPPKGWVPTRYEAKARAAARPPVFLEFQRIG